jgi:hypothetical protein
MANADMGSAFDSVGAALVSFDDAGVGALPAAWVRPFGYFGDGGGDCMVKAFRGKNPPGW